jgi:hypothetical protein
MAFTIVCPTNNFLKNNLETAVVKAIENYYITVGRFKKKNGEFLNIFLTSLNN